MLAWDRALAVPSMVRLVLASGVVSVVPLSFALVIVVVAIVVMVVILVCLGSFVSCRLVIGFVSVRTILALVVYVWV